MSDDVEPEAHREWGKRANQRVWSLIGDGPPAGDSAWEAIDAAHASLWHWSYAGGELERQRGEWLLSHVYALTGDGTAAVRHAQRCWAITETEHLEGFDYAYACEALARAHRVNGDTDAAGEWHARAAEAGSRIADAEDRSIFEADLGS